MNQSNLTLWDYFRSSACYRVRIALNLKNLTPNIIPIHLLNNGGEQYSDEYQKINPQSLVPALQDGQHLITQSLAIIEYLDEVYPTPALLPQSAYEKALVRSFSLTIVADTHPLNNLRVLKYLTDELHVTDKQKETWYHHWIKKGLSALETKLNITKTAGLFCFGDQPTIADICLVPQLYNAKRFNCDISAYPTLCRIDEHCQKLDAFVKAIPTETAAA